MNFKTFLKGLQWTATSGAYFEPCQTSVMEHIVKHCVKSVRVRSYFGPDFPIFGLNTERYEVSLRIQSRNNSEYGNFLRSENHRC